MFEAKHPVLYEMCDLQYSVLWGNLQEKGHCYNNLNVGKIRIHAELSVMKSFLGRVQIGNLIVAQFVFNFCNMVKGLFRYDVIT